MPHVLADALEAQAELRAADSDCIQDAIELDHQALGLRVEHGLRACVPDSLEGLARHGSMLKRRPEDIRTLAASDAARRAMRLARAPNVQAAFATAVAKLREVFGDAVFEEAWNEGARLALDEAVAYARRARGVRGRPASGWTSLTPTELDVVRLVAAGLNNPEIGTRLFMSRSTVKTHLSHVFAKLDVLNRTELASLAIRHLAG